MDTLTPLLPILRPDLAVFDAARARQNQLTKPPGSLGVLEDVACRFAAWQRRVKPEALKPAITVFAADHGVAEDGVSAFPQAVTAEMVKNFAAGGAAICVLARANGARLEVVDVGVASELDPALPIVHAKVAKGSANLAREAALTEVQLTAALEAGAAAARRAIDAGAKLLVAGDMGIANTTPSAALICAYTGLNIDVVVGRGTGVDDAGLARKRVAVAAGLARVAGRNLSASQTLAELGGLEIAAIAGFYLEGARLGVPSLVDGFIATAAALAACRINPGLADWLLASHVSQETGHALAIQALGLAPLVDLKMRLGEGSGAAVCLPLIAQAIALHNEMATFLEAGVSDGL
ncbi:nicotinate-nucleotide--dimethylbenzimidazole phosphoribosyltransferase [Crenobacter cavernae]|uniref:Nicotinate-nucleotide--dimethylbenzimidazole phosphoribosyltransferase n=1 Tax=Crenobacter cavernae TaxID=2290923 RepID=A0ABY0FDA7_9NEIS|nr:nicotinate-nucleotide--dimethylbenzimidazole phosphoribosyltransferase [Crenobacter cavernae]RXZ43954.1 nicotinate-nucleotide--dimethylbenzimidazole phosphoribosyltransferase [Crenobacter cavernae]